MSASTKHGMAPSTRKNFKTHVTAYVGFCLYYNLDMFPADVLQEHRYLQYLSEFHKNIDSSKSYVGGMRALHEMFQFKAPPADDYMYQLTATGLCREKGHVVRQAALVTLEILAQISQVVNLNDDIQYATWVTLLAGFYLLFRKSNLVPDSCINFDPRKQLTRGNFVRMRDCYVVRVYRSKTIQFHEKCLEIPMLPNPDIRICPVYWLDQYFSLVSAGPMDPAFCVYKVEGNSSISYAHLAFWLKEWVTKIGLDPEGYTSHGIRRGRSMGSPLWIAQTHDKAAGGLEVAGL